MLNFDSFVGAEEKIENICVVKVTTDYWTDSKGLYSKKSIRFLRRKCKGYNMLEEDCLQIGADFVMKHIENLNNVQDGVYKVVTINETRDFESGYIEDYDYLLVKYEES